MNQNDIDDVMCRLTEDLDEIVIEHFYGDRRITAFSRQFMYGSSADDFYRFMANPGKGTWARVIKRFRTKDKVWHEVG